MPETKPNTEVAEVKETLTQIETEKPEVLNLPSVTDKEELRHQKRREYMREYNKKYYEENREKRLEYQKHYTAKNKDRRREYHRNYQREHYNSDPEFRERKRAHVRESELKLEVEYKRFKIECGGKCVACGLDDIDFLDPHHPHGRKYPQDKAKFYTRTQDFRDWKNKGIKPDVVLLCVKCHRKLERAKKCGEPDPYA